VYIDKLVVIPSPLLTAACFAHCLAVLREMTDEFM
jgi:hypothetical protein